MKTNMGTADRIIRTIAAILIGLLCYSEIVVGVWAIVLGIVGIILLVTSIIGYCPLYALFHIKTGPGTGHHTTGTE